MTNSIRYKIYRFHQHLSSVINGFCKYIIYKIFKRKRPCKLATIYISEKYKKIIIAPEFFNKDEIYYEQETCSLLDIGIDNETLGIEIADALNKFTYKDKNLRNNKSSDWPAFKCSKLKTIKLFKKNYKYISVRDENDYLKFSVEYPVKNKHGNGMKILEVQKNMNNFNVGKKIKEIYKMTEEDIKILLGDT